MKKLLLWLPLAASLVLTGLTLYFYIFSKTAIDPEWYRETDQAGTPDTVTVRFTGTATLLFSDGETAWMVDGWFTRPSYLDMLRGKIMPDVSAVKQGLINNEVDQLAAVIPVHSHYDHAMDAPEVCLQTNALLIGSESTANIGRGWGLEESQIKVIEDRKPFSLGQFTITPIIYRHYQFPGAAVSTEVGQENIIRQPLVPPASAYDYKMGEPYALHVAHPQGSFVVVGSAGVDEGVLEEYKADVLFLGLGGLAAQTDNYRESYWRETVTRVSPKKIIPIHFDSLMAPIDGKFRGPELMFKLLTGGDELTTRDLLARKKAISQTKSLSEKEEPDEKTATGQTEISDREFFFQALKRYEETVLFD